MKNRIQHISLIIVFLTLLITPLFVQMIGLENSYIKTENKTIKPFPKLTVKKPFDFIKKIKHYYKHNFGLRNILSDNYLTFKNTVLKESPLPNKVVKGKNDFLFLGNKFSNVVKESLGFSLFSNSELKKIKNNIVKRKEWLQNNNIKYYIAIAPSKHSVYRTNLPFYFPNLETRKEQVIKYIKKEIDFNIIDLGVQFTNKKARLYKKLDSHWNDLGAFYAYQTLMNNINLDFKPKYKIVSLDNYKIDSVQKSGDIAKMIKLKIKLDTKILTPNFETNAVELNIPKYYSKKNIYESRYKNPKKKYKILMFRDSFSSALIPFLNESFGESTYIWSHKFNKDLILKEKPDIVIFEYVERYLERLKYK